MRLRLTLAPRIIISFRVAEDYRPNTPHSGNQTSTALYEATEDVQKRVDVNDDIGKPVRGYVANKRVPDRSKQKRIGKFLVTMHLQFSSNDEFVLSGRPKQVANGDY